MHIGSVVRRKANIFPPLYRTGICPVKEGDFVLKGWRFYVDSCIIE